MTEADEEAALKERDAERKKKRERRRKVAIGAVVVASLLAFAAMVFAATRKHSDSQTVWFTAAAAGIALVTFVSAAIAVVLALPAYWQLRDEQERTPKPKVWWQQRLDD